MPRIVYDLFFFWGGQEWCIEGGNSERCLKWDGGGGGINESLL